MKLVTVQEMVNIEKEANARGLTYDKMMENAGRGLAEVIEREYGAHRYEGVLGLIGSGNNGGDTLVALTYLAGWGWRTCGYLVKSRSEADPLVQRYVDVGGQLFMLDDDKEFRHIGRLLKDTRLVLDGILGTGTKLPLKDDLAGFLRNINRMLSELSNRPIIVAVDCPSGIDCSTGECADEVISADLTVTMAAVKTGCLKMPAYKYCGRISLVGIGLDEDMPLWRSIRRHVIQRDWVRNNLPLRPDDGHKGTFGSVLIIAGSKNYIGAALLAAKSSYKTGCGLVTLAVNTDVRKSIAGEIPEATWITLPDEDGFLSVKGVPLISNSIENYSSVLVGPGLGLYSGTREFMRELAILCREAHVPLVIDADGLKLLSDNEGWERMIPTGSILTPHPGEMAYLTGLAVSEIQQARLEIAEKYAALWGHVLVLKGAFTIVSSPDNCMMVNPVATSALAKAGSGDVLAGIIAGFRAQRINAFESAVVGTWIHAQAGVVATGRVGSKRSVLASDLIESIPEVFRDIEI